MSALNQKIFAPLLSLFLVVFGSGYFVTFLSVIMVENHESSMMIGAMSGFYYTGFLLGSFKLEHLILRVGHIRAFSALASSLAVITLLNGLIYNMPIWWVLRFLSGVFTAGIFVVIESWMLCNSTKAIRGRLLSFYMMTLYSAQATGQLMINVGTDHVLLTFGMVAMVSALSVIPLCVTHTPMPTFDEASTMNMRTLITKTTSGVLGCFLAGMILGASYALYPAVFMISFEDDSIVSVLMFALILGGMLFQYPIGKLSDMFDRRLIVIIISILMSFIALLLYMSMDFFWPTLGLIILFGGMSFTIYPVSISHTCDSLDYKDIIAAIQGLLFAYCVGATLGPFVAPVFMYFLGTGGLMVYFMTVGLSLIGVFAWRKVQKESPPQEEPFQVLSQTTPVITQIDPRSDKPKPSK